MKPGNGAEHVDASGYLKAHAFLTQIKKSTGLTYLEKRQLWDMTVRGDIEGAKQKYKSIVKGWYGE